MDEPIGEASVAVEPIFTLAQSSQFKKQLAFCALHMTILIPSRFGIDINIKTKN